MEEYILYGILGLKIIMDIPFLRKRIITDSNMLNVFKSAKNSIEASNNIKIDVAGSIKQMSNQIHGVEALVDSEISEFKTVILEFQEGELYKKMLRTGDQIDELHKTLQNKDDLIKRLMTEAKETKLVLDKILNRLDV